MNEEIQRKPLGDANVAGVDALADDPFDALEESAGTEDGADIEDIQDTDAIEDFDAVDDDGEGLTREALDELAAIGEAEAGELASARAALEAERAQSRAILERYRAAALAGEPDLLPELVHGDTLEELEASLTTARSAVDAVRRRLEQSAHEGAELERGFPAGAPARGRAPSSDLTAGEKIRYGLEQHARG